MNSFELALPTHVVFGAGQVVRVGEIARRFGRRALVVTGSASSRQYGTLDRVATYLRQAGVEAVIFNRVQPNPLSTTADEGAALARSEECDLVVGVGGGSAMDCAKAIALATVNEGGIWDYIPTAKPAKRIPEGALPIVLVTTTAGTGTEVDRFFVLTNPEAGAKVGTGFSCTYSRVAIVDPELTLTVPPRQTAATGLDVLFHAVESYVHTSANRVSDMMAEEAMRVVAANLETVYRDGNNIEARTNMAWGNIAAGIAEDRGGVVLLHNLAHPVGALTGATHGLALAACCLPWMHFSLEWAPERFALIAEFLGEDVSGLPVGKAAAKSVDAMERILRSVDASVTLRDLGVRLDMVDSMARDNFRLMPGLIEHNPRLASLDDVIRLYREAL